VRVEPSALIPINVYTRDNDTNDTEHEPWIESTVITLNYHLSSQLLEFLSMIHRVVSSFSFSRYLEMCPESSIPLLGSVVCSTRHPTCPISASLEVMPRVSTALHFCCI